MRKGKPVRSKGFSLKVFFKVILVLVLILLALSLAGYGLFLYYKPMIKAAVDKKVQDEIHGEIGIGKIGMDVFSNFPTVSITLQNIYLHDLAYQRHKQHFFESDRVDLEVDVGQLLERKISINAIRIKDARIFVFRTKTGYSNLEIFKKTAKPDSLKAQPSVLVNFRNIVAENMSMTYFDSLRQKSMGVQFIRTDNHVLKRDSSVFFHVTGDVRFDGLMFNREKGSFLKDTPAKLDLHVNFFPEEKRLSLDESALELKKTMLFLGGEFQFASPPAFMLRIRSDQADYGESKSVLSPAIQKKLGAYSIEKPIAVEAKIQGPLGTGEKPFVDISFSFKNSKVTSQDISGTSVTARGSFHNHLNPAQPPHDSNARLRFDSVKGTFFGIPVKASATLDNLLDPYLTLEATANFKFTEGNRVVDPAKYRFSHGLVESSLSFAGKIKEVKEKGPVKTGIMKGYARIQQGGFKMVEEELTLDAVNAEINFTQDRLDIVNLSGTVNKNPVEIKGSLIGFLPFLQEPDKGGKVNLTVNSPHLDLTKLLAIKGKQKPKTKKERRKQLSQALNKIYEGLEFDLTFGVKDFTYRRFVGKNMKGNLKFARDKLVARKMSVDFAAGKILFNLNVDKILKANSPFSIRASFINVGIKEFFYSFDNFNQKAIQYQNLQGKLTMDATFQGRLNAGLVLIPSTLLGKTTFRIRNGRLIDFQPLENMSNFLFSRRDFSDVKFAEIRGALDVKGSEIDVSRMEIQSTVISAFVEGRYSLKDSTDLSIQLPLSNLKRRDKNFKPRNVGTDAKVGLSVYLRARSENGETVISYDPLKRGKKRKS